MAPTNLATLADLNQAANSGQAVHISNVMEGDSKVVFFRGPAPGRIEIGQYNGRSANNMWFLVPFEADDNENDLFRLRNGEAGDHYHMTNQLEFRVDMGIFQVHPPIRWSEPWSVWKFQEIEGGSFRIYGPRKNGVLDVRPGPEVVSVPNQPADDLSTHWRLGLVPPN